MTELAAVAAFYPHIKALGAELLAISTDSAYAHLVFKQITPAITNLAAPLVSDRTHEISSAYRVLDRKAGAAFRASVFISPDQIIRAKFVYPKEIGRNISEHVRLLQAFQYAQETGQGVPANWVPSNGSQPAPAEKKR
ncbi:peroxiredoxin (alkyl hydroperoxide reductase subunit C) [Mesobacillus foraminis]|uniref:Peroxiredoxin (Alkyl hydroperoxide reductase subunit C) n=2 Tax=Mesobacillus foraminis TaxID=279826 RepID=A0A4R2B7E2_9BACI|nr:peroxiredoxin (alkyl hydroperoxide reductase subunit C) [Mesobacillus foraminis]